MWADASERRCIRVLRQGASSARAPLTLLAGLLLLQAMQCDGAQDRGAIYRGHGLPVLLEPRRRLLVKGVQTFIKVEHLKHGVHPLAAQENKGSERAGHNEAASRHYLLAHSRSWPFPPRCSSTTPSLSPSERAIARRRHPSFAAPCAGRSSPATLNPAPLPTTLCRSAAQMLAATSTGRGGEQWRGE